MHVRRCFVHVNDSRNNILLTVFICKKLGVVRKELPLFGKCFALKKFGACFENATANINGVLAYLSVSLKSGKFLVDFVPITCFGLNYVIVQVGFFVVDVLVIAYVGFVAFISLFDVGNVVLVKFL